MKPQATALALLLLAAGHPAGAQEETGWLELRTAHFHLISNAGADTTEVFAHRLERFRRAAGLLFPRWRIDPPPLSHVFVFRDWESFRPYTLRTVAGQPALIGGFMTAWGSDRVHIAVNLSSADAERALIHEYAHMVARMNFDSLPNWLQEGWAGLLENSDIEGRRLVVGRIPPGTWERLQTQPLLSWKRLLESEDWSEWTRPDESRRLLYAQSLLLTQFLLVAEQGKYRARFLLFLRLLGGGAPQEKALQRSFGGDWESLEPALQTYLLRESPEVLEATIPPQTGLALPASAALSDEGALAHLAELWLNTDRRDEAEKALLRVAAGSDASAEVHYLLGRIALDAARAREAEQHFRAGLRLAPESPHLRYFTVRAFFRGRLGDLLGTGEMQAAMDEMVDLLTPLTEEPVLFPDAFRLLVHARISRGDPPAQMIPLVEEARRILPDRGEFDLLLGHFYAREEKWVQAQQVFQRLLTQSGDDTERKDAREWLRFLRVAQGMPPSGGENEDTESEEAEEEEVAEEAVLPRRTFPGPAGVKVARGILAGVRCREDSSVLTLHVNSGGGKPEVLLLKLSLLEPALLFDRTAQGQDIECDTAGVSVAVQYRPEPESAGLAGTILTLEFYPIGRQDQ